MAWEEIVDYTVPSNTTSVTLNNFGTITKDDFIKIVATNVRSLNETSNAVLQINNNSSNSYPIQILLGDGSSVVAARTTINGLRIGGTLSNTNGFATAYLKISENNKVNCFSNANFQNNNSDIYIDYSTTTFDAQTITSFTLNSNKTNAIGANSRIQIYKLAAEKVADVLVNANTTQVDITGLDIKKGDEYLLITDMVNGGSVSYDFWLYNNNNTTASNYYSQRIDGNGSSAGANRINNARFLAVDNNRSLSYAHLKLSNIGAFTHQSYSFRGYGITTPVLENHMGSTTAENITSVNQLNLRANVTNGIGNGTRFQLYKLYEGGN